MSKTIEVEVFKFQELKGHAHEKARDYLIKMSQDDGWWDNVYEDWEPRLEELGYMNPKIWFSHMYCQGAGACFETRGGIDIEVWLKAKKLGNKYRNLLAAVKRGDGSAETYHDDNLYHHYNTMYVRTRDDGLLEVESAELDEVSDLILADARSLAKQIFRDLEEEDEYLCSDKVLEEFGDDQDILFMDDGTVIRGGQG